MFPVSPEMDLVPFQLGLAYVGIHGGLLLGMAENNRGKKMTIPGLFSYLALIPAVCIEMVRVYICILTALVKPGDGVSALQDQKGRVGAFWTFFFFCTFLLSPWHLPMPVPALP